MVIVFMLFGLEDGLRQHLRIRGETAGAQAAKQKGYVFVGAADDPSPISNTHSHQRFTFAADPLSVRAVSSLRSTDNQITPHIEDADNDGNVSFHMWIDDEMRIGW